MGPLFPILLLSIFTTLPPKESTDDRMALVTALYRDFGGKNSPLLVDQSSAVLKYFTPSLAHLLFEEGNRRIHHPGEIGLLDFEPLSGSQDPDVHDLRFLPLGKVEVQVLYRTVSFPTGQRVTVRYHLRPVGYEWRIDDIIYTSPRCRLCEILS
jgi:hypothetical protein